VLDLSKLIILRGSHINRSPVDLRTFVRKFSTFFLNFYREEIMTYLFQK